LTVEQASEVFASIPQAGDRLSTLVDVGLGYIKLGQPAPTLSGGEAQRVKLATELSRRATGKTLYLIDEPTTGLSFYDVHKLMDVMQRLVDKGNSILVIEHNLDVIRCADWLIDLGPEGGDKGGEIVVVGTPETVADHPDSHTGRYLRHVLEQHPPAVLAA
jgi:excinuclease ABC subunit A